MDELNSGNDNKKEVNSSIQNGQENSNLGSVPPIQNIQENSNLGNVPPIQNDNGAGTTNANNFQEVKNKKSKTKFFIGAILILIAIGLGLYVGYQKINGDPLTIYKNIINDTYKSLNDYLAHAKDSDFNNIDFAKDPFTVSVNANFNSSMSELKNFSGLNYQVALGFDVSREKLNLEAGIKDGSKNVVDLFLSLVSNRAYFKSEKLFDRVIYVDGVDGVEFDVSEISEVSIDDYKYILKKFKDMLIESLNENKLTMKEETITINNKEYKTNKAVYLLDKENMEQTLEYMQKSMVNDEKLLTILANITGESETSIKNSLNEEIDMSDYQEIELAIYIDKLGNIIAGKISQNNKDVLYFDSINDVTNVKISGTYEEEDCDILINALDDGTATIDIKIDNNEVATINAKSKDEWIKMDYTIFYQDYDCKGSLELEEKDNNTIDFDFSIDINEEIDFSLDGTIKAEKSIDNLDVTKSVNMEDLSDDDISQILENLSGVLETLGLGDLAQDILNF